MIVATTIGRMKKEFESIVINWHGPVAAEEIDSYHEGGLYVITGYKHYGRKDKIQYIGITERSFSARFDRHHKIKQVVRNRRIWVGEIVYPTEPSRTKLERAEGMLIYALQPDLNQQKKFTLPRPAVVVSHWFTPKKAARFNHQGIFSGFPDVISWDGKHWREGNLRVFTNEQP